MRLPSFRAPLAFPFSIGAALLLSSAAWAAELHPVETELRRSFPSISLESSATFEAADTFVDGRLTSGLRARFARIAKERIHAAMRPSPPMRETAEAAEPALSVIYPHAYNGLLVAELGSQRVVLRAIGALGAPATESGGKLVYTRPYTSIDVVEIPNSGRSEELLLLRDQRAPLIFEYEIVATEGVMAVAPSDGAIRFLPMLAPVPEASAVAGGRFTHPVPALQIDRPWVIDAWGKRTESQARWTLIGDGPIPKAIRLTVTPERLTFPLVVDPSFSATGRLATQRYDHTATLLPNGKVLIAGGFGTEIYGSLTITGTTAMAELYDPALGTFSPTGSLATARMSHTATLLPNGKVLIAGGWDGAPYGGGFASAELYDPAAGTFSPTGSMVWGRSDHTATLLPNGKVLIAGDSSVNELYDPATGTFSLTGNPVEERHWPTATLLPNGKVLIAGGSYGNALASAELYDPASGTTSVTGSLATARDRHTATLLPNGKVLIAGGYNTTDIYLASAELYDPAAGTFSPTGSLANWRCGHTATLLPNGKVLITGGSPSLVCELYDPVAGTFSSAGSMAKTRSSHTGTLLANGRVLIAGGFSGTSSTSAELYDAAAGTFSLTGSLTGGRENHTATPLPNGKVLIAGGWDGSSYLASAELYDAAVGSFSATGSLATARRSHTATLLANGKVLIAGGPSSLVCELYDPAAGTFSPTGSLTTSRYGHTATLLPNGKVLIAGGSYLGSLASAELYDPDAGTFSATDSLATARYYHTATLLPNGKVLIAGGYDGAGSLSSAELYDPATGTFSATGSLTSRYSHSATLLANGKVLIAGGYSSGSGYLTSAELYDPAAGAFTATASLATKRRAQTATLLPNGKVLIAGGYAGVVSGYLALAELYDPAAATFTATGSLATKRDSQTATLLVNGKVLIAGGYNSTTGDLTSAELYDVGDGFADSRRPVIVSAPAAVNLPATLTLTGTNFKGDSEASCGGTNSSPTNYPLLQLMRIDNEQTSFVAPSSPFSDTAWSGVLTNLPAGTYRVTIFTNAVPSTEHMIHVVDAIPGTPTIATISPSRGPISGGQSVIITGTNLLGASVTIGGSAAAVTDTTSTTIGFTTPAHPVAVVDVTVTTNSGTSTSAGGYTYTSLPNGDANGDGSVTASDIFYLINYLFAGGTQPVGSADANGDGTVTAADIFYLINYLFAGGPAPR